MSEWMKQKPFLCLNPTQKSEILAFLCNELLNNKVTNNLYTESVFRIHVFFGLPDPDPLFRGIDPDPTLHPDPSIIMQK
jgi:hypothetical protein